MANMTVGALKEVLNDLPEEKNIRIFDENIFDLYPENSNGLVIQISEKMDNPIVFLNGEQLFGLKKIGLNWKKSADVNPHNSFSVVYYDDKLGGSRIVGVHK